MAKYRPNVAAIMRRSDGKILVAERSDVENAWQFPQGGVDSGEDLLQALFREVEEEIGVVQSLYQIEQCRTNYRYTFPKGHKKNGTWVGQEQTYFLCRYLGTEKNIDLGKKNAEFTRATWIDPQEYQLAWLPKFKRSVYKQVFQDFFGVTLKNGNKPSQNGAKQSQNGG